MTSQKWIFVSLYEYDVILLSSFNFSRSSLLALCYRYRSETVSKPAPRGSSSLIADRMKWLEEEKKKVAAMPKKEQVQVSRDLTEDRKKRLEEKKKAAARPEKEQV